MVRRHWRKLVDFLLVTGVGVLLATHLGSQFIPGSSWNIDLGFSTAQWDGNPAPASGYSFGILDTSTQYFSEMCTFTTDADFPAGETALSNANRQVYAYWYLTSYQFAKAPTSPPPGGLAGCGLNLDWCGGAYCWGVLNADAFYNYLVSSADYCGQALFGFADVEYSASPDPGMWDLGTSDERRTVINAFESKLANLAD